MGLKDSVLEKHVFKRVISPINYPGGKTHGIKKIFDYLPADEKEFLSPFLGGGPLELNLANLGYKVHCCDIFKPIINFWQSIQENPIGVYEGVKKFYPITDELFDSIKGKIPEDKLQSAIEYFVLNRTSYSALCYSGGRSPGYKRFTPQSMERLLTTDTSNMTFELMDFRESLNKYKDLFTYLDPPYFIEYQNIYGKNGKTHADFNHEDLADILHGRNRWVMSYNYHEYIAQLYKGFRYKTLTWKTYRMRDYNKEANEILIFSNDLDLEKEEHINAF